MSRRFIASPKYKRAIVAKYALDVEPESLMPGFNVILSLLDGLYQSGHPSYCNSVAQLHDVLELMEKLTAAEAVKQHDRRARKAEKSKGAEKKWEQASVLVKQLLKGKAKR